MYFLRITKFKILKAGIKTENKIKVKTWTRNQWTRNQYANIKLRRVRDRIKKEMFYICNLEAHEALERAIRIIEREIAENR